MRSYSTRIMGRRPNKPDLFELLYCGCKVVYCKNHTVQHKKSIAVKQNITTNKYWTIIVRYNGYEIKVLANNASCTKKQQQQNGT